MRQQPAMRPTDRQAPLELPPRLVSELLRYRSVVWTVKIVEGALAAGGFRDLRTAWLWANGRKERTLAATYT